MWFAEKHRNRKRYHVGRNARRSCGISRSDVKGYFKLVIVSDFTPTFAHTRPEPHLPCPVLPCPNLLYSSSQPRPHPPTCPSIPYQIVTVPPPHIHIFSSLTILQLLASTPPLDYIIAPPPDCSSSPDTHTHSHAL